MHAAELSTREIQEFGRFMSDGTARSLHLLRAIESTVLAVGTIRDQMVSFKNMTEVLTTSLSKTEESVPEMGILDVFEEVQDGLGRLHATLEKKLSFAKADTKLRDEDAVCDVYDQACESLRELHDTIEHLRWDLMQHNATRDRSNAGPELTTEDSVRVFLASL